MSKEGDLRLAMARLAKSLFDRGYSVGSAGNISARLPDGVLITPTNSSLGALEPERIAKLSHQGEHLSGDQPSKEFFLHQALYETRAKCQAIVHLHSTYATALSCLADLDDDDCLAPITPYAVMRVGKVARIAYFRPGDRKGGDLIRALDGRYGTVLLANHGPIVTGKDLTSAVYAAEELEETAKLLLLLNGRDVRQLTTDQVEELKQVFGCC